MIVTERENGCVGCETCVNCGRDRYVRVVDYFKCDKCGDESVDELYDVYGEQLCDECALKQFNKIDEDNFEDYLDNEDE